MRAVIARELRAHPPLEPGRHGRAAAAVPRGESAAVARADRRGDRSRSTGSPRPLARRRSAAARRCASRAARDGGEPSIRRARAHRHAAGGRLLPPRRHPAVRAAQALAALSPPNAGAVRESGQEGRRCGRAERGPARSPRAPAARPATSPMPAAVWARPPRRQFAAVSTIVLAPGFAPSAPRHGAGVAPPARRLVVMGHIDEIGVIVTHIDDDGYLWFREVGGRDPSDPCRPACLRPDTRSGPLAGVVGKQADPPAARRRPEEGRRGQRPAHRRWRARRRPGARAGSRSATWRSSTPRPSSCQRPPGLARAGQPPRLICRAGGGAPVAEAGGAGWEVAAVAAAQEETTFGGSRTSAFSLEPDAAIVLDVHARHRRAGHRGQAGGQARARLGRRDRPRLDAQPWRLRAAVRGRRGREDPLHASRPAARDGHRRRRRPPQPRRRAHRARLDLAALHALARRARSSWTT